MQKKSAAYVEQHGVKFYKTGRISLNDVQFEQVTDNIEKSRVICKIKNGGSGWTVYQKSTDYTGTSCVVCIPKDNDSGNPTLLCVVKKWKEDLVSGKIKFEPRDADYYRRIKK